MLAEAEARYQREAANLQRERTRHQDALHSNSQHRRVIDGLLAQRSAQDQQVRGLEERIDDLQAQRSAQDQHVRGLEERVHLLSSALTDTVTNSVERERELAAANTGLEDQLGALRITNASLAMDNSALCEHLCALAEDRDTLARRCEVLEAEKELLTVKVARLEIDAASNVVLRSKIDLLEKLSVGQRQQDRDEINKLQETSRIRLETLAGEVQMLEEKEVQQSADHNRKMDDLQHEFNKQRDIHERKMSMLRDETNEQQATVERQAQAWQLMWMEAAKKQHDKQGGNADKSD